MPSAHRRSGTSPKRPSVDASSSWSSHQLEGDGLLPLLYHHLFKKNKQFQSCPGARIPDTVVYEHNFPRAWYRYEAKTQEIVKLSGRFLDTAHINHSFGQPVEGTNVVAKFLFTAEEEGTGRRVTSVEYLTKEDLFVFLNLRKDHPDGILQRFLEAKSRHNCQIQAIWSPRVTMVRRRSNKATLDDKLLTPYERCVTFDGPSHYSEDKLCALPSQEHIKQLCLSFVEHFHSTDHKTITRMVLFFKVDAADNVWLLWCNSLRIAPPKFQSNARRLPLNLAPHFVTPKAHVGPVSADEAMAQTLHDTDALQFGLSHDLLFARSLILGKKKKGKGFPRLSHPHDRPTAYHKNEPTKLPTVPRPLTCPLPDTLHSLDLDAVTPSKSRSARATDSSHPPDVALADVMGSGSFSLRRDSLPEAQQLVLARAQAAVEAAMDDVLYNLAGHRAQKGKRPYTIGSPAPALKGLLSQAEIDELMLSLGLARTTREGPGAEDVYECAAVLSPIAHLEFQLRTATERLFRRKTGALASEGEGLPGLGLGHAAVDADGLAASDMLQSLGPPLVVE